MIIRVSVVLRRTVCGDFDWRFDNLSGSHLQSQVNCGTSVGGIPVGGIPDVIGTNNIWTSLTNQVNNQRRIYTTY